MPILDSVRRWFRGKQEGERPTVDPSAAARGGLDDAKREVAEFVEKLADLAAELQRLEADVPALRAEVQKWERLKGLAASAGDEGSVRQAVESRMIAERKLAELEGRIEEVSDLRHELDRHRVDAQERIDRTEGRLPVLDAQRAGAHLRERMAEADVNGPLGDSSFAAVDSLEEDVQVAEARAGAMEQIAGTTAAGASRVADSAVDVSAVDAEVQAALDEAKGK